MSLISRLRSFLPTRQKALTSVDSSRGWVKIFDWFPGAWQQDVSPVGRENVLAFQAVYACVTLIAQDIGKLRLKLMEQQKNRTWVEIDSPAFSPVLRKPNKLQNRIKFIEYWVTSKLVHGNAYALKRRDNRGVVVELYLLDPCRVTPLVSDDGSVFYQLRTDNLSGLTEDVIVPAREIIHDSMVTLFHPLCGVSPLFACGLTASQGLKIQKNSEKFFANMSRPSGILVAPGAISKETAATLKEKWDENYGGNNVGKTAVLGDGLKYEPMYITATDAQLIEQLKWTAEMICSCFHVPPYMIGVGAMPTYNNIEALNQQYYSQCLQSLIESIELCLDEGLDLVTPTASYGVELDVECLLRMDTATRYESYTKAINGGWLAPNEARKKEDLQPVAGGDSPLMQQQNYSLAALAKRDASDDPFGKEKATATPASEKPAQADQTEEDIAKALEYIRRELAA